MRIRIQLFISARIRIQGVNPCVSGSGYPRRRSGSRCCRSAFVSMRIRIQLFISLRIRIQGVNPCVSGSGYPRRRSGSWSSRVASVETNADPDPAFFSLRIRIQLFISLRIRIQLFISLRIRIQGARVWIHAYCISGSGPWLDFDKVTKILFLHEKCTSK
jgi:hypothetical protein